MKVNFPHNALLIGAAYAGFADAVGAHAAGHGAAQTVLLGILIVIGIVIAFASYRNKKEIE